MNQKEMVVVGFSALLGGISGYLLADWLVYKYITVDKESFDRMQELAETYDTVTDTLNNMPPLGQEEMVEELRNNTLRTDYTIHSKPDLSEVAKQITNLDAPHIITLEEFEDGISGYESVDIKYYKDDGIFASAETDEEISAPQNLFGPNVHLHFGEDSDDPDIVYVSNPRLAIMYEIVQIYGSYAGMVNGENKTPPKKKAPAKPRRKRVAKTDDEPSK